MDQSPMDRGVRMLASIMENRAMTQGWKDRIPRLDRLKMLPLREVIREFKDRFEQQQQPGKDRAKCRKLKCYEGYGVAGFLGADPARSGHTVVSAIEACDGCVIFIVIFNAVTSDSSAGQVCSLFPRDVEVVLKEPVLSTVEGSHFPLLFVQSPLSVEIVEARKNLFSRKEEAREIRLKGNEFFAAGSYVLARLCYDASIARSSKKITRKRDDEEFVLASSNRAEVFLRCQRYEEAIADCNQVLGIDPRHPKCLYRKAMALSALQQHRQALELLNKALTEDHSSSSSPSGKVAIKSAISRCSKLLKQSESGVYDLEEFLLSSCRQDLAPECADFVGPVEIRMTGDGRGRGVFVTRRVDCGELLLVANPIVYVPNLDRKLSEAELQGNLVVETVRVGNSSTRALKQMDALAIHHNMTGVPKLANFGSNSELDTKEQASSISPARARQIIKMSSFGPRLGGDVPKFAGIWGLPGLINHSCLPNVASDVFGRAMMIRAARDLEAGEEIVLCYVECLASWWEHRRDECFIDWRFTCKCKRCELESRHHEQLKTVSLQQVDVIDKSLELLAMAAQVSQLEQVLDKLDIAELEKVWIRAGGAELYCNYAINELGSFHGNVFVGHVRVMEMLQFTAPGWFKTRFLLARLFLTCPERDKERAMKILVRGITAAYGKLQVKTLLHIAEAFGTDEGVKRMMGV
ncbi:uncharacterized protein LOC112345216 [Selaginella moellendorffii]|uniref:uncharacterized protein LOC112345216 n=1 Tax=Selaginella moellendorffii TaxID=88036 RepID=UPI000D1D0D15|nr:uncharacterized protein LOC112345216 [Selaginella moellendorffii]|eukprot:XP_024527316.1 uncharacterized protein LOC112345216 [Selaginella moellendorffii]